MSERHVAMQGTEDRWEALRRIVVTQDIAGYAEATTSFVGQGDDGGVLRAAAKEVAARHVLRYMDELDRQQREEGGEEAAGR